MTEDFDEYVIGPTIGQGNWYDNDAATTCGSEEMVNNIPQTHEVTALDLENEDDEFDMKAVEGKKNKRKTKLMTGKLLHDFVFDEHDPCWTAAEATACVEAQDGAQRSHCRQQGDT